VDIRTSDNFRDEVTSLGRVLYPAWATLMTDLKDRRAADSTLSLGWAIRRDVAIHQSGGGRDPIRKPGPGVGRAKHSRAVRRIGRTSADAADRSKNRPITVTRLSVHCSAIARCIRSDEAADPIEQLPPKSNSSLRPRKRMMNLRSKKMVLSRWPTAHAPRGHGHL